MSTLTFHVYLEDFFNVGKTSSVEESKWSEFFELKAHVYQLIEEQIKVGTFKHPNEALVYLKTNSVFIKSLDLKTLLMVGKVKFSEKAKVEKFISEKYPGCWNHYSRENIVNDVCLHCYDILRKILK